jgi:capsule polysaccharide export protein KpsE/RkpR
MSAQNHTELAKDKMLRAESEIAAAARLRMMEARKALEDYETANGFVSCSEYAMLTRAFSKSTQSYLRLSANQR